MDAATTADEELVAELRVRLKPSRGAAPKREHILAAIALARDPGARPVSVYEAFGVPAGGARSRVIEYRDRILRDGITMETEPTRLAVPMATSAGRSIGGADQPARWSSEVMPKLDDCDDTGSRIETRPGAELDDVLEVTMQLEPLLDDKVRHEREQQRVRQARYAKRKLNTVHAEWSELTPSEQKAAACFGFNDKTLWDCRFKSDACWRERGVDFPVWIRRWGKLTAVEQNAAHLLGYSKHRWQTEDVRGILRFDSDYDSDDWRAENPPLPTKAELETELAELGALMQRYEAKQSIYRTYRGYLLEISHDEAAVEAWRAGKKFPVGASGSSYSETRRAYQQAVQCNNDDVFRPDWVRPKRDGPWPTLRELEDCIVSVGLCMHNV